MKPKLEDVARAAGVSTATVSRCLNEPAMVTAATRKRVLGAVEALGYTPNFGGKALASQRTRTVGAVLPTLDNAIFARGLQSFQETLALAGVTLLVASSGYDAEREAEQVRSLIGRGADGILLIGTARLEALNTFLERTRTPVVIAWAIGDAGDTSVGFDNVGAARAMARRVLDYGHREIAMISGVTNMNDRAAGRIEGVRLALAEAGIDPNLLAVEEVRYSFDEAGDALERLMALPRKPTAIVCGNDVLGVGAIARAKTRGLRIPDDLSVTGFDDIDVASIVEPGLTTVHVPHWRMGRAAAEALLALIDGREVAERCLIETSIRERGSLGPVSVRGRNAR